MRAIAFILCVAGAGACTTSALKGHALLDEYVATFRGLSENSRIEDVTAKLDAQEAKGATLARSGAGLAEFVRRHKRLLEMTRLALRPDPDGSRRADTERQLSAFAAEVEGAAHHLDPGGGLAAIAPVLDDEVLNLRMLLDGTHDRAAARAKYSSSR